MADSQIKVYVRKGTDKGERVLSFIIPHSLSQSELMEDGWGIDGNQALCVEAIGRLVDRQKKLAEWFRQKGYDTLFC